MALTDRANCPDCSLLARYAEEAMTARGFLPNPPAQAMAEAEAEAKGPPAADGAKGAKDLSALPWTSIDNTDTMDLDQIEAAEKVDGGYKLYVGVADVDAFVKPVSQDSKAVLARSGSCLSQATIRVIRYESRGLASLIDLETSGRRARITETPL